MFAAFLQIVETVSIVVLAVSTVVMSAGYSVLVAFTVRDWLRGE